MQPEVGLLEVSFPGKVANAFGDKFNYVVYLTNCQSIRCMVNARSYGSINAMFHEVHRTYLRAINKLLEEMDYMVNFQYVAFSGCITFTYTKNAEDVISVEFSNDVAKMLGFKANKQYVQQLQKETKAKKLLHLSVIMNNVYICCNLLEHIIVGDTKTPQLNIVNRKTIHESGIR